MGESLKTDKTVRDYLLGRISDETTLEGIEELLFTDDDFCSQVALTEDDIINDYVLGHLDEKDAASFRASLAGNPERRFKLELSQALREKALARNVKAVESKPSFFASLSNFFRQPKYAGAFAVLLIAVLIAAFYFFRKSNTDDLAELQSIYKKGRPTESRISTFGYAPLTQLRGAPEPADQKRLRRIENSLIDALEKNPNAETHHALGVFYLTQLKYTDAIKEFESALKLAKSNAKTHNDIGAAHYELSKTVSKEKKLEELAKGLEEFTRATELDANLLEALFNKSLAMQELGLSRRAKDSWTLYLQKDPTSQWADEARKNLARIEGEQSLFKSEEQVLSDYLIAYRNHDEARAQKIHNETKGTLKNVTVPLQLSRRFLVAKKSGNGAEANESLEALTFIGNFEKSQNGDSFFFELANFYANVGADKSEALLEAQDSFAHGYQLIDSDYEKARSEFERSRDLFARLGDECEAAIAENWAVQFLPDVARVGEGRRRMSAIIAAAESRNFKILLPPAYYWLAVSDFRQDNLSQTNKNFKTALRLAEAGNNAFEVQHAQEALASYYSDLGELEQALAFSSKMLPGRDLYYQNLNQSWREKGTLADLTLKLGFFAASLSFSKEALEIARADSPNSDRVNSNLRNLANAAVAQKDFAAALQYAGESEQLALKRGDSAENTQTTAEVYLLLADIKSQANKCDEALTDYDKALELYNRLPEFTFGSYRIHKGKLLCFHQLGRQDEFSSELKTVLKLSEAYRTTIREDSSRQAFFANERDVFDVATSNTLNRHESPAAFDFVEESKARSLLDFVESTKSIAEVEKNFGRVARPLSLLEIQKRLPEKVQFVQYVVLPESLAMWIVSTTRFDFVEKQIKAGDLEEKIVKYQALIIDKGPPADIKQAGQELYDLLVPKDLAGEKQLCLIPDKSLHQLAFASLVSPAGKYLLEDFALFYAPSASVLVLATENAGRKEQILNERLLSVGNPDFDREDNPSLSDLKDAEAEAKVIAEGYTKSLVLVRDEATKDKFLLDFAKAEVVHFAGHFVTNRQSPGNSKLLFAGGELRSSDLSDYKLPKAKLVILSACETGFERYNKSEGSIGIARTLLALGAPVVVASQWKVDSAPTKDLMIAFHRNRKQKGMTSAESLRRAQLELIGRDETKAPFYWAAFSMYGGYSNY